MPTFEFQTKDGHSFQIDAEDKDKAFKAFQKVQNNVPRGGYVGQTLKGAAQSYAGLANLGLGMGDIANATMGTAANVIPGFGAASTLSSIIPSDWRKGLSDFANEPYAQGYETAGRIGYWGAPMAAPAKGAQVGIKALKESPQAMQIAKGLGSDAAIGLGAETLEQMILGHLPFGLSGIAAVALKHGLKKGLEKLKGAAKEGAEELPQAMGKAGAERGRMGTVSGAKEGAEAAPKQYKTMEEWRKDWGPGGAKQQELEKQLPQVKDTPPPAKPRIRVPAQSKPTYNFGKARDEAGD